MLNNNILNTLQQGIIIMGMGRKKCVLKMKRKKGQVKVKNRLKRKIAAAKK